MSSSRSQNVIWLLLFTLKRFQKHNETKSGCEENVDILIGGLIILLALSLKEKVKSEFPFSSEH